MSEKGKEDSAGMSTRKSPRGSGLQGSSPVTVLGTNEPEKKYMTTRAKTDPEAAARKRQSITSMFKAPNVTKAEDGGLIYRRRSSIGEPSKKKAATTVASRMRTGTVVKPERVSPVRPESPIQHERPAPPMRRKRSIADESPNKDTKKKRQSRTMSEGEATSPVSSLFVALQHNITTGNETGDVEDPADLITLYTYGIKDFFTIFFYFLIAIVIHAVVQEYVLDKVNRKMHLSKVKHSKFNESGQLLAFYGGAAGWGLDILLRENYVTDIARLWTDYPHAQMPFIVKFYFITQLAYWIHTFPELYFQKVKKDEMPARIQYATLYMVFIAFAYFFNFTRVALCILVLHYAVEFVFHLSRLLYFADKTDFANTGFIAWDILFVLVRLVTITLAVLTFLYGLEPTSQDSIKFAEGNFNTSIVRINCLAAICLLQAWLMWNFITFHLRRLREQSSAASGAAASAKRVPSVKTKAKKSNKVKRDEDSQSSTDAAEPASENGSVRQRTPRAKRL